MGSSLKRLQVIAACCRKWSSLCLSLRAGARTRDDPGRIPYSQSKAPQDHPDENPLAYFAATGPFHPFAFRLGSEKPRRRLQ